MSIQNATLRPALTLAAAVVLAGCAGAQSDFQCNATAGDTCMTMEAANDRARELAAPVKPGAGALPRLADRPAAPAAPAGSTEAIKGRAVTLVKAAEPADSTQAQGSGAVIKTAASAGTPLLRPVPRAVIPVSAQVPEPCAACGNVPAVRSSAVTASVWIAPYVDDADVLHQPGRVSFVATPSRWHLPAQAE
ncbi:type IV conjugative transfer system lipoprotein TraV [Pantoea sp. M_9]|uniref:type IV conjugative transfer system lipoprotein TraV n=1 Tax=Pantoea sp. M_9 TaxID=2608041 RepID=UPI001231E0F2|nr:type IV conjugative transfer system lipoprotein TraV [Pantoea sp. M_9]KAA5971650.1 type IV conjugative transfer system lipoprotein TraV [Pantoea sp. M_9]